MPPEKSDVILVYLQFVGNLLVRYRNRAYRTDVILFLVVNVDFLYNQNRVFRFSFQSCRSTWRQPGLLRAYMRATITIHPKKIDSFCWRWTFPCVKRSGAPIT